MSYPKPLERLIEAFERFPGIGRRTAERLAFHVLRDPEASELAEGSYGERQVTTTLDGDLQRIAARTVRRAGLGRARRGARIPAPARPRHDRRTGARGRARSGRNRA